MNNTQALHRKYTVHPLCAWLWTLHTVIKTSAYPHQDVAAQTAHRPGKTTGPNPSWSPIDQAHDLKRGRKGSRSGRTRKWDMYRYP
ncbi:uncharacterized protein LY79DRAFT_537419 [Colletotrichum navitas]|uniref:Secreted protein n=1 Tax=Colletotrichum navitas TaxID=681940 RepID=A0AAD8Q9L3_9PEZI|nr:uncharacterized protein LY79DRAFT_537419 [Colletotrichum navitas]KAK1598538.1 hypothetical protein LY79DRAFT_537419 [Colletotrichum navitas]